ncbi:MAG: hypothetical protein AAB368_11310, partial [bacterium]
PGPRPLRLDVDVLGPAAPGHDGATAHYEASVAPGGRISWRLPLLHLRYTYAWTWPAQPGLSEIQSWGESRDMKVASVGLHVLNVRKSSRLRLYRLRLDEPVSATGWVDRFGQRSTGAWPGKVFSDADLRDQDAREEAALPALAPATARDEYRAWTGRPALSASGWFRLERVAGVWWLVAPSGRLYWSSAVDCVVHGIEARLDDASRPAYSWLPPDAGEFANAWGHGPGEPNTHWPAFYRVNLIRKWGPTGEYAKWRERAYRRLLAWNFTGLGNWCDESLFRDHRLPYVTMGPHPWLAQVPYAGNKLQDVYDPAFAREAAKAAAPLAAWKDDPWCVGHFIENECGWADLPGEVLGLPTNRPAKAR